MATRLRGRWALGITPRHFTWILKDKLAICERPGGYGENHRRVRRQEEIIWIRENGLGSRRGTGPSTRTTSSPGCARSTVSSTTCCARAHGSSFTGTRSATASSG